MHPTTEEEKDEAAARIDLYPGLYLKLDAFSEQTSVAHDKDGDTFRSAGSREYTNMCGVPLRVLICASVNPFVAARQLMKLAKWLKKSPELLDRADLIGGRVAAKPYHWAKSDAVCDTKPVAPKKLKA